MKKRLKKKLNKRNNLRTFKEYSNYLSNKIISEKERKIKNDKRRQRLEQIRQERYKILEKKGIKKSISLYMTNKEFDTFLKNSLKELEKLKREIKKEWRIEQLVKAGALREKIKSKHIRSDKQVLESVRTKKPRELFLFETLKYLLVCYGSNWQEIFLEDVWQVYNDMSMDKVKQFIIEIMARGLHEQDSDSDGYSGHIAINYSKNKGELIDLKNSKKYRNYDHILTNDMDSDGILTLLASVLEYSTESNRITLFRAIEEFVEDEPTLFKAKEFLKTVIVNKEKYEGILKWTFNF